MARRSPLPPVSALPYGSSGGGGSSASPFQWVECATRDAIQAAIADGAQILVTADISLGAAEQIELVAGTVTIGRKAGVTIAGGSGEPIFLADGNIAARLILVDPHPATDELGNSTAFLASHASVGPLCEVTSGSLLAIEAQRLTLNLAAGGSLAGDGQRLGLSIGSLVAKCPDGSTVFASEFGAIRHIETLGGGSTASIALNTDVHGGRISGELRSSGSGAGITVAPNTGRSRVTCGPLNGAYAESTGVLIHVFDATLIECPGAKLYAYGNGPQVIGGKTAELMLGGLSVGGKAAAFHGLEATRLTELGTTYRANFQGCRWAPNGADTITSYGEGSTWDGGEFYAGGGSITFATGSQWAISGAVGGLAITISSGAQMRVRDSELAGITNSDPLSIITGSRGDALALDTTPATRRYGDATLDAILENHVAYWSGKSSPCPNKAPLAACNAGGAMRSITGAVASTGNAFDLVDATDQMIAPLNSWSPGAGDFSLRLNLDLDVTSAGEENIIDIGGFGNLALNLLSTGALRLYVGGANVLDTSSSSITTGGGDQRITVDRTNGTITIRVNGVSRGTVANATPLAAADFVILGTNGANAIDGKISKITILDMGIPDATEQLWDTYSLAGAGA